MESLKYAAIALLSIGALCILVFAVKTHKPLKTIFINALLGVLSLAAINLTTRFTGVHIPVNTWTAAGSAVYGIPAVCGLLAMNMIIK